MVIIILTPMSVKSLLYSHSPRKRGLDKHPKSNRKGRKGSWEEDTPTSMDAQGRVHRDRKDLFINVPDRWPFESIIFDGRMFWEFWDIKIFGKRLTDHELYMDAGFTIFSCNRCLTIHGRWHVFSHKCTKRGCYNYLLNKLNVVDHII